MRFLLDSNLSPRVATLMRAAGIAAEHVREHGLQSEPDVVILAFARDNGFVVVSEDTDFGELLACERATTPSLVLLRTNGPLTPDEHAALLLANLPTVYSSSAVVQWSSSAEPGSGCEVCPCYHRYPSSANRESTMSGLAR